MVGQRAAPGWPADERRRRGLARARGGGGGRGEAGKVGHAQLRAHPRAPPLFPLRCRRSWRCKPPPPPPRGSGSPPPTPRGRGARHRRMVPCGRDTARGGAEVDDEGWRRSPPPGRRGGIPACRPSPPPATGAFAPLREVRHRSGSRSLFADGLARDSPHCCTRAAERGRQAASRQRDSQRGECLGPSLGRLAIQAARGASWKGTWVVCDQPSCRGHALHDPEAEETRWIMEGGTGALLEPTDFSKEVECLAGGGVAAEPERMRGIARVHRAIHPRS